MRRDNERYMHLKSASSIKIHSYLPCFPCHPSRYRSLQQTYPPDTHLTRSQQTRHPTRIHSPNDLKPIDDPSFDHINIFTIPREFVCTSVLGEESPDGAKWVSARRMTITPWSWLKFTVGTGLPLALSGKDRLSRL